MRRCHWLAVFAFVLTVSAGPAQPPDPVTFADVVRMVKDEFKEEKIVRLVRQSPTKFVLSAAQVAELKAAGASQTLIDALAKPGPALPTGSDIGAVVLVLDCSGSMSEPVPGGGTKWAAAQQAAREFLDAVADGRDVAFIVYGTDAARQCDSVDVLRPMGAATAATAAELRSHIDRLKPAGHTPIARSLEVAGEQLAQTTRLAKVVVITDGMETCHGDPAKVAAALKATHKHLQSVEVIGLGLKPEEKTAVEKIAKAGAGRFYDAKSAKSLTESVRQVKAAVTQDPVPEPEAGELTAAEKADFDKMYLFSKAHYDSWENGLHTEVLVNGQSAGVFKGNDAVPVGKLLKKGENVLQFRTFSAGKTEKHNGVTFAFGPAARNNQGKLVMDGSVWRYDNAPDWVFQEGDGSYVHKADQDTPVTARVYFTGLAGEKRLGRDQYAVLGLFDYDSWGGQVTATLYVNGVPVNSFFGKSRTVVITPLLKPGVNTIKMVVRGMEHYLGKENKLTLIAGPSKFDTKSNQFAVQPQVSQKALIDLRRNEENKWVSVKDPNADTVTYTHELTVKDLPAKK